MEKNFDNWNNLKKKLEKNKKSVFFGVPLSSIQKENQYYFNFEFKGKVQSAIMCQAKSISVKRLCDLYGEVNEELFKSIKRKVGKLLNLF